MAVELLMRIDPSGAALVPVNSQEAQTLFEMSRLGGLFKIRATQARTNGFHRKGMALFRFLFNLWEPVLEGDSGAPVAKDFESFRGNLIVMAGFYRQVFNLEGGFELKPLSLNWGGMDNIEFHEVYNRVIDVGLQMIGKADHLSRDQVDAAIAELMEFA